MMYTSFFNLNCKPFQLTPDPDFLFPSRHHKRALTYLNYGIAEGTGFILITGEVGTGKTTVIRSLIKGLREEIRLARIFNTRVTSEQLISMINEDFGLDTCGKDKTRMMSDLTDFLIGEFGLGRKSIIIIDEAQNLSLDLLEEIRLLSNLETDKSKLVQIILAGQPELRKTLAQPELRQLRQRINVSCHIQPLTRSEMEDYVFHSLGKAGNRDAVAFHEGALDSVHSFSRGIPRLINIACDFLMLSAFVDETREISLELAREVVGDLETENRYWQDEVSKRYFTSNADVLRDIVHRLDELEVVCNKGALTEAEKQEISERLSKAEGAIESAVKMLEAGPKGAGNGDGDAVIESLRMEIEDLKAGFTKLRSRNNIGHHQGLPEKKSLWNRFF